MPWGLRRAIFPIKEVWIIYKCNRCKETWRRPEEGLDTRMRCINADCQGGLITKLIRFLKGEEVHSYGIAIGKKEIPLE
jgi:hypothetical protein